MIGNKQIYTVEAKNKQLAIKKITPELEKRGLILIKTSIKRKYKGLGRDGVINVYEYRAKPYVEKRTRKPIHVDYFVNYGVTSRHLHENKIFNNLKDAKNLVEKLENEIESENTQYNAWELIRRDSFDEWGDSKDIKLGERVY